MEVRNIDFVVYQVSDMDRSIKFYSEVIGLKLDSRWREIYAEFDVNGAAFALSTAGSNKAPGGCSVAFNVANLDETIAELKTKGVEPISEIIDTPVCRMAVIPDPDGNTMILHEKPKAV